MKSNVLLTTHTLLIVGQIGVPHHTAESKVDGMTQDHKISSEQCNPFFSNFQFSVFIFYPSSGRDTKLSLKILNSRWKQ